MRGGKLHFQQKAANAKSAENHISKIPLYLSLQLVHFCGYNYDITFKMEMTFYVTNTTSHKKGCSNSTLKGTFDAEEHEHAES